MPLSISLIVGVSSRGSSGGGFAPSFPSLPAGTVFGAYDPMERNSVFQTSALLQQSSNGDPVGAMLDVAGAGSVGYNLESLVTSGRGTLNEEIGPAGTLIRYVSMDGINDGLRTPTFVADPVLNDVSVFVAMRKPVPDPAFVIARGQITGNYIGVGEDGVATPTHASAGSSIVNYVDGIAIPDTRNDFHDVFGSTGEWTISEIRNADLSSWTRLQWFSFNDDTYTLNGDIGRFCVVDSTTAVANLPAILDWMREGLFATLSSSVLFFRTSVDGPDIDVQLVATEDLAAITADVHWVMIEADDPTPNYWQVITGKKFDGTDALDFGFFEFGVDDTFTSAVTGARVRLVAVIHTGTPSEPSASGAFNL